jgi:hypothetical protein
VDDLEVDAGRVGRDLELAAPPGLGLRGHHAVIE